MIAPKKTVNNLITWRFILVCVVLVFVFVTLMARAAYLQVIEPDKAREENEKRTVRVEKLKVQRGMIFDRNGNELAISVPVVSVYADPLALDKELAKRVLKTAKKSGENVDALEKNEVELTHRKRELYQNDMRWRELADVLQEDNTEINGKLRANTSRRFVYLKRQVTPAVANYIDDSEIARYPSPRRIKTFLPKW